MRWHRLLAESSTLYVSVVAVALAKSPYWYSNILQCKNFSVEAKTAIYYTGSIYGQSTWQSISVINKLSKNPVKLDLKQHRSKDALVGRLVGIDGIANMWVCIHSNTGEDFLLLYFFCSHEDATSCEAAMDAPGNEWNGVYDEHGRPLLNSPPWISKVEETRLRKLGLWSQLVAPIDPARVKFVYRFTNGATKAR